MRWDLCHAARMTVGNLGAVEAVRRLGSPLAPSVTVVNEMPRSRDERSDSPKRLAEEPRPRRRRSERMLRDWRESGGSFKWWNAHLLSVALICVGLGILVAGLIRAWPFTFSSLLSPGALWAGLVVGIVLAARRGIPRGLTRFELGDLVWGLSGGLGLRIFQGYFSAADQNPFPQIGDGAAGGFGQWLALTAAPSTLLTPLLEEFFFRGVVLVAVFQIVRRSNGTLTAVLSSLIASSGSFVMLHAAFGSLSLSEAAQLFCVGAVCATLVIMTGRIWAAVLAHMVYNMSFVALMLAGTGLA